MSECLTCEEYDLEKHYCPKFCDVIEHTIEDRYQQGRADAIGECIRELAKMSDCKNSLLIRLEQLKEQKNG